MTDHAPVRMRDGRRAESAREHAARVADYDESMSHAESQAIEEITAALGTAGL
jgi:hypothetical protein